MGFHAKNAEKIIPVMDSSRASLTACDSPVVEPVRLSSAKISMPVPGQPN
jgi:hypothetical protein